MPRSAVRPITSWREVGRWRQGAAAPEQLLTTSAATVARMTTGIWLVAASPRRRTTSTTLVRGDGHGYAGGHPDRQRGEQAQARQAVAGHDADGGAEEDRRKDGSPRKTPIDNA